MSTLIPRRQPQAAGYAYNPSVPTHRVFPGNRALWLCIIAAALILLTAPAAQAQQWRTQPISDLERSYMDNQRAELDGIARQYLGRQFNGEKQNDLEVLQLLLDRHLIRSDQTELLQAMGFVLGDHLQREKRLNWVVYEDRKGRSRALEIPEHREFLFPTTMISRRVETGAQVDVQEIYASATRNVDRIRRQIIVR